MQFRKINNEIVNKSASEKKSNLRPRNKTISILLLKTLRNKGTLAVIKNVILQK